MSYYGFLARVALGVVLGLIFYYGKNIWLNIFAHFLNNGIAVTQLYILTRSGKNIKEVMNDDSLPFVPPGYSTAIAAFVILALGIFIMQILFKEFKKESIRLGVDKIDNTVQPSNNPFDE
jgi:membrane protease YdiL (CAAX protease family)